VVKEIEFCCLELHKDDLEALLFGWLNSLISFLAVEMLLFKMFNISELLKST
jgi:SHS2 domain-containing protein